MLRAYKQINNHTIQIYMNMGSYPYYVCLRVRCVVLFSERHLDGLIFLRMLNADTWTINCQPTVPCASFPPEGLVEPAGFVFVLDEPPEMVPPC